MRDLAAAWRDLAGDLPAAGAVGAELIARWSEPHRRYHTLDHLRAVLAAIEPLAFLARDPAAVRLAAWFHDAVYDGRPGWDEERSAQLAHSRLSRLSPMIWRGQKSAHARAGGAGSIGTVVRLVRLTAGHDPAPGDRDGEVLCDADLAVLAGPGYDAYARAVREEYRHVPDDAFRAGRARVLENLLAMPVLYRTEPARDLWESAARRNVRTELAALTAQPSGR
ncbi:metal-dependent phosphohydrolase [Sphaerisporangium sp. NPDC051011]|uniref:HD domain-containing protein n=1 Tax=Sphaerisporangium sp. NPDC051011 TaxID=3155792 RepID=UPI0033F6A140